MADEDLKALYKHYEAVRDPRARADCPFPEVFALVAADSASASVRTAVLAHITRCPQCRRELDRLRSLDPAHRRRRSQLRWALAAAVLVLGAVLAGWLL